MKNFDPSDKEDAAARAADRVTARDEELMAQNTAELRRKNEIFDAVDERVGGWFFLILLWWSSSTYGFMGFLGCIALVGVWAFYSSWKDERRPGARTNEAVGRATQYVRLRILFELSQKSNLRWTSRQTHSFSEKLFVTFEASDEFNENFWPEVERVLPEFERISPYERQKRINNYIKELSKPLDEAEQFAKKNGIELDYWLQDLRPRKKEEEKS